MKKLVCILTMTVFSVTIAFAQFENPEEAFTHVDKLPKYPGGESAMNEFISKNLKYPKDAREKKIQGKVYIKFIVEKDGSIVETSHLTTLSHGCSDEADRVIKAMPKWSPVIKNNKQVRTVIVMPIIFALGEKSSK